MSATVETKPLEKDETQVVRRRRRRAELAAESTRQPPVPFLPPPKKYSLVPEELFRYWAEMDSAHPDRVLGYVYRVWPKIDRTKAGLEPDNNKYIDKIHKAPGADPLDWKREMLHRYGTGSYKLVLTDGLRSKSLCQTVIPSKDLDDDEYPPVLDLSELDMNHPENQSYIRQLEVKGVLAKESEMHQAQAVETMAGLVREVVRDSQQRPQPGAQPADPAGVAAAVQATAQAMGDVTRLSNQMMRDAFTQVATATADQSSPKTFIEMLTALANILTARQEHKGDDEMNRTLLQRETELRRDMEAMRASMFQLQLDRIKALEDDLKTSRTPPVNPPLVPGSLADTLKTIRELREAAADLLPGGGEETSAKIPWWAQLAQSIANAIPAVGGMVVQATYNLALARGAQAGTGAGSPPPMMPAAIPAAENPGTIPGGAVMPDATGTSPQEIPPAYAAMLAQLEGPLARHLNEGLGGDDFANGIVQLFGLGAYRQARALGKEMWQMLLNSRPLIAPLIQANPQQFEVFLDEFMQAEQIWAEEEAAGQPADSAPVA